MPDIRRQGASGPRPDPKTGNIISRIGPIGFDQDEGITILLYGRAATGKTTLWSTFPKPIFVVLCSGGLKPGELRSIDTPEMRKVVSKVELHHSSELRDVVPYIQNKGFKTAVIDHVSGFQDLVLKEVLGLDEIPVQKTWGLAQQQQWGQVGVQCKDLLRGLLDLNCNRVFVTHERDFGDKSQGSEVLNPFVGAGLTPTLAGWLNGACDYVCQTYLRQKMKKEVLEIKGPGGKVEKQEDWVPVPGEVDYVLRTERSERFITKFRVPRGAKLENIVDPSYDKIIRMIRGAQK